MRSERRFNIVMRCSSTLMTCTLSWHANCVVEVSELNDLWSKIFIGSRWKVQKHDILPSLGVLFSFHVAENPNNISDRRKQSRVIQRSYIAIEIWGFITRLQAAENPATFINKGRHKTEILKMRNRNSCTSPSQFWSQERVYSSCKIIASSFQRPRNLT